MRQGSAAGRLRLRAERARASSAGGGVAGAVGGRGTSALCLQTAPFALLRLVQLRHPKVGGCASEGAPLSHGGLSCDAASKQLAICVSDLFAVPPEPSTSLCERAVACPSAHEQVGRWEPRPEDLRPCGRLAGDLWDDAALFCAPAGRGRTWWPWPNSLQPWQLSRPSRPLAVVWQSALPARGALPPCCRRAAATASYLPSLPRVLLRAAARACSSWPGPSRCRPCPGRASARTPRAPRRCGSSRSPAMMPAWSCWWPSTTATPAACCRGPRPASGEPRCGLLARWWACPALPRCIGTRSGSCGGSCTVAAYRSAGAHIRGGVLPPAPAAHPLPLPPRPCRRAACWACCLWRAWMPPLWPIRWRPWRGSCPLPAPPAPPPRWRRCARRRPCAPFWSAAWSWRGSTPAWAPRPRCCCCRCARSAAGCAAALASSLPCLAWRPAACRAAQDCRSRSDRWRQGRPLHRARCSPAVPLPQWWACMPPMPSAPPHRLPACLVGCPSFFFFVQIVSKLNYGEDPAMKEPFYRRFYLPLTVALEAAAELHAEAFTPQARRLAAEAGGGRRLGPQRLAGRPALGCLLAPGSRHGGSGWRGTNALLLLPSFTPRLPPPAAGVPGCVRGVGRHGRHPHAQPRVWADCARAHPAGALHAAGGKQGPGSAGGAPRLMRTGARARRACWLACPIVRCLRLLAGGASHGRLDGYGAPPPVCRRWRACCLRWPPCGPPTLPTAPASEGPRQPRLHVLPVPNRAMPANSGPGPALLACLVSLGNPSA